MVLYLLAARWVVRSERWFCAASVSMRMPRKALTMGKKFEPCGTCARTGIVTDGVRGGSPFKRLCNCVLEALLLPRWRCDGCSAPEKPSDGELYWHRVGVNSAGHVRTLIYCHGCWNNGTFIRLPVESGRLSVQDIEGEPQE